MALEKRLADTDSIYCTKVTNSNQSSIFISNLGDSELDVLFGADYKSDDAVRLRLNRRNLAFNVVAHVVDGQRWYKRKSSDKWDINSIWLNDRMLTLADVFTSDNCVFIAYLNKDDHSTHRLYMKGMASLPREDGGKSIALRDFLFSGDIVVLTKLENGDVSFEIKIPDNPVVSSIITNGADTPSITSKTRQLITYGAPGTGKSHKIDKCTNESNAIRVTFHPDTDYAAFVGAYKPTMEGHCKQVILDYENLVDKFKEYLSVQPTNVTRACALFGYDYHDSITDVAGRGHTIPELVNDAYKSGSTYDSIVRAGMSVYEQSPAGTESIAYAFVPQAFMKAYVEAWRRYTDTKLQDDAKTYYLVIEEINRGNCAQIFGDLFQLLDRADNGFSAYAITPDDDIQKFLEKDKDYKLVDIPLTEDVKKTTEDGEKVIATAGDIKTGKKLVLPPNLCIWATMNTSDQSLFPIDSAFKRRWEWEYVPIEDAGKGWKIEVGGEKYEWWSFLEKINAVIATETSSEDKQLGYFFVKAKDKVIDAKTFVAKVIFYLWGDVFKDNLPDEDVFKYTFKKDGKDDKRHIRFADFYHPEAGSTKEQWRDKLLVSFLEALKVVKESPEDGTSGAPGPSGQNLVSAEGGSARDGE